MGCAASTTASTPTQQAPLSRLPTAQATRIPVVQVTASSSAQQQPASRPVAVENLQRPPAQPQARGPNVQDAPVVKSLVSLQREDCPVDGSQDGCHVTLRFSLGAAGEVAVFFLARELAAAGGDLPELEADQVSRH